MKEPFYREYALIESCVIQGVFIVVRTSMLGGSSPVPLSFDLTVPFCKSSLAQMAIQMVFASLVCCQMSPMWLFLTPLTL